MRITCTRCRLRIFCLSEKSRVLERVIVEMSSRRTRIDKNRENLQELSSDENRSRILFVKAKRFIWIRYRSNHEIRFTEHSRNVRWIFNREIEKEMCLNECRLSCQQTRIRDNHDQTDAFLTHHTSSKQLTRWWTKKNQLMIEVSLRTRSRLTHDVFTITHEQLSCDSSDDRRRTISMK
jgi:hypothetical protein